MDVKSGFRVAPNWSYVKKMIIALQFANINPSSNVFKLAVFLFSGVLIVPNFMLISLLVLEWNIFLYKRLTRNFEIGNTPISFFINILRMGRSMITNSAQMSLTKCY